MYNKFPAYTFMPYQVMCIWFPEVEFAKELRFVANVSDELSVAEV